MNIFQNFHPEVMSFSFSLGFCLSRLAIVVQAGGEAYSRRSQHEKASSQPRAVKHQGNSPLAIGKVQHSHWISPQMVNSRITL